MEIRRSDDICPSDRCSACACRSPARHCPAAAARPADRPPSAACAAAAACVGIASTCSIAGTTDTATSLQQLQPLGQATNPSLACPPHTRDSSSSTQHTAYSTPHKAHGGHQRTNADQANTHHTLVSSHSGTTMSGGTTLSPQVPMSGRAMYLATCHTSNNIEQRHTQTAEHKRRDQ